MNDVCEKHESPMCHLKALGVLRLVATTQGLDPGADEKGNVPPCGKSQTGVPIFVHSFASMEPQDGSGRISSRSGNRNLFFHSFHKFILVIHPVACILLFVTEPLTATERAWLHHTANPYALIPLRDDGDEPPPFTTITVLDLPDMGRLDAPSPISSIPPHQSNQQP